MRIAIFHANNDAEIFCNWRQSLQRSHLPLGAARQLRFARQGRSPGSRGIQSLQTAMIDQYPPANRMRKTYAGLQYATLHIMIFSEGQVCPPRRVHRVTKVKRRNAFHNRLHALPNELAIHDDAQARYW